MSHSHLIIRRAEDRGHADHGWLKSAHSFSFANYVDPAFMGFSVLRVINDDRVVPDAGFPRHPHRDMEIVSYVVEGALGHRDTLGNGSVIRPGEIQRMSAGRGIAHSEMNAEPDAPLRFLQIWFLPRERGTAPGYEQRAFPYDPARPIDLLLTTEGEGGTVRIGQDVRISRVRFERAKDHSKEHGKDDAQDDAHDHAREAEYDLPGGRAAWIQMVRGELSLNGEALREGDGAALHAAPGARPLRFVGHPDHPVVEALLIELPPAA